MTDRARTGPGAGLWLWVLGLVCAQAALAAETEPRAWLMRMVEAVEQLSYQGTLVHMHGGDADIMSIVHRVEDGRISERITAVDGPGREIIRNDEEVTCILPDQQAVVIEPRDVSNRSQSPLQGSLPRPEGFDERYYELSFLDTGSVAGRAARVLAVRPLDELRYGYVLWLDTATAMPLKTQLLDEQGRVLEQILFTEIDLRDNIPAAAVAPSLAMETFAVQRSSDASRPKADGLPGAGWQVDRLPAGFMLIAARAKLMHGSSQPMEQLVYSDGLASVSVFVESDVGQDEKAEGLSSMGSANAYTTMREGFLVTAVGDVPVRTVEMMARSASRDNGRR